MSANHAKDFANREASARETARWLRPTVFRAADQGMPEVSISVKDMNEILAYMEAAEHKEKVEFSGHRIGYSDPTMMREMLSRNRATLPVLYKKTDKYRVEIFYRELPPKPEKLDTHPVVQSE